MFVRRLRDRSTLTHSGGGTDVWLAVALIRRGITIGGVIGSESTDDAYVRGDQILVSSHIAGCVASVPVRDNETVKRGQLIATIRDDGLPSEGVMRSGFSCRLPIASRYSVRPDAGTNAKNSERIGGGSYGASAAHTSTAAGRPTTGTD